MTADHFSDSVFKSIETQSTTSAVVDRLEVRILDKTFKVGDLLPSEGQLADQFGVGRRSIREALRVLETRGLVEVRMGVGTVVKRNDLDNFLAALVRNITTYVRIDKADVNHVADLRLLLETAALERLAISQDAGALARLDEIVEGQKRAQEANDINSYQDWHFRFHCEIVDSLNNPLVSMIYQQVLTLMRAPMERAGSDPIVMSDSIHDHEKIVNALWRRSTDDVRELVHAHLQDSVTNIQNAIDDDQA